MQYIYSPGSILLLPFVFNSGSFTLGSRYMSRKVQRSETEEELVTAFRAFDKDGKCFITSVELRHILTNLGDKLADEEAESLVNQADPQGGGQINYASFVRMMMQAMK